MHKGLKFKQANKSGSIRSIVTRLYLPKIAVHARPVCKEDEMRRRRMGAGAARNHQAEKRHSFLREPFWFFSDYEIWSFNSIIAGSSLIPDDFLSDYMPLL